MTNFALHPQLQKDCHILGESKSSLLLLMNNALLPWFILVPKVAEAEELFELNSSILEAVQLEINSIGRFVKNTLLVDKVNIAAIGNKVRQLHIHIVGRREGDFCWPGVVWGQANTQPYRSEQIQQLVNQLKAETDIDFTLINLA